MVHRLNCHSRLHFFPPLLELEERELARPLAMDLTALLMDVVTFDTALRTALEMGIDDLEAFAD